MTMLVAQAAPLLQQPGWLPRLTGVGRERGAGDGQQAPAAQGIQEQAREAILHGGQHEPGVPSTAAARGALAAPAASPAWQPAQAPAPAGPSPAAPEYGPTLEAASEAYRRGDYAAAVSLASTLLPAHARSTEVLLLLGAAHYQLQAYDACVAFNDACILVDPRVVEAHANLANALLQLGSPDLAIM